MKRFIGLMLFAWAGLLGFAQPSVQSIITDEFLEPYNLVIDPDGVVYITDSANHQIKEYNSNTGVVSLVAGEHGGVYGAKDGPGFLSKFFSPRGLVYVENWGQAGLTVPVLGFEDGQADLSITLPVSRGLIVGDTGNNTIRLIDLGPAIPIVGTLSGLAETPGTAPVKGSDPIAAVDARYNTPLGMAQDPQDGSILISDAKNNVIRRLSQNLEVTTVYDGFFEPAGMTFDDQGRLFIADTRNHLIKIVEGGELKVLAGKISIAGTEDSLFSSEATFNNPSGLQWMGDNLGLIVTDTGNHSLRRVYLNPNAAGLTDFFPEWNGYSVELYAGIPGSPGLVNGSLTQAQFRSPLGLALEPQEIEKGLLIIEQGNNALRRIQTSPVLPRVPDPVIGRVTFVIDDFTGIEVTRLVEVTNGIFLSDNSIEIAFLSDPEVEIFYRVGDTPGLGELDLIPSPARNEGELANEYRNGMTRAEYENKRNLIAFRPDMTIKAIATASGRRPSNEVQSRFQFRTAAPIIVGNNPLDFRLDNNDSLADMYYTANGDDPITLDPDTGAEVISTSAIGPIRTGTRLSLPAIPDGATTVFKVRARRTNYSLSALATREFTGEDVEANSITFGFRQGEEASSNFKAAPGQRYYAPITFTPLEEEVLFSLQFYVGLYRDDGGDVSAMGTGFRTMLKKFDETFAPPPLVDMPPQLIVSRNIETNVISGIRFFDTILKTNDTGELDFSGLINVDDVTKELDINPGTDSLDLQLLAMGWAHTGTGGTLFNPNLQHLISHSQALDNLFETDEIPRSIIGGYYFEIPNLNTEDDAYEIFIGRPSGTRDGFSEDVFIDNPFTAAEANAPLAKKTVNVIPGPELSYIAGDAAPFVWFNAGEFGDGRLVSSDVVQTMIAALRQDEDDINQAPMPVSSDLLDAVNTCCGLSETVVIDDPDNPGQSLTLYLPLDANDDGLIDVPGVEDKIPLDRIDEIAFGDYEWNDDNLSGDLDIGEIRMDPENDLNGNGQWDPGERPKPLIDVRDVLVAFHRSINPSHKWFRRYRENRDDYLPAGRADLKGEIIAIEAPNLFRPDANQPAVEEEFQFAGEANSPGGADLDALRNASPFVSFEVKDVQGAPGELVVAPVMAEIHGENPIRVLMLHLNVNALNGAPPLNSKIQFLPSFRLGKADMEFSPSNSSYAGAWLDEGITGLTGVTQVGILRFTIPDTATEDAVYSVQMTHASASPNGLAAFPVQVRAGLVKLRDHVTSSWGDEIPDEWRLRFFGGLDNLLSHREADADGDGHLNWQEFIAGTNPSDRRSMLKIFSETFAQSTPPGTRVLRWPSVKGKFYQVESSAVLNGTQWVSEGEPLPGTGLEMRLQVPQPAGNRFYRITLTQ
jgi:hypothetical protein